MDLELAQLPAGSLIVFGDVFGGRIDNTHTVVSVEVGIEGQLLVTFNLGETLEVWDPAEALIRPHLLRIGRASRVKWNWLYYGAEDRPENHVYIQHEVVGSQVQVTSNAPYRDPATASIYSPAVEIVPVADWLSGRWIPTLNDSLQ